MEVSVESAFAHNIEKIIMQNFRGVFLNSPETLPFLFYKTHVYHPVTPILFSFRYFNSPILSFVLTLRTTEEQPICCN